MLFIFSVLIMPRAFQVSQLQEMLEAKQKQLREVLSGGAGSDQGPTPEEKELLRQREEYARRGIRYRENWRGFVVVCPKYQSDPGHARHRYTTKSARR